MNIKNDTNTAQLQRYIFLILFYSVYGFRFFVFNALSSVIGVLFGFKKTSLFLSPYFGAHLALIWGVSRSMREEGLFRIFHWSIAINPHPIP